MWIRDVNGIPINLDSALRILVEPPRASDGRQIVAEFSDYEGGVYYRVLARLSDEMAAYKYVADLMERLPYINQTTLRHS